MAPGRGGDPQYNRQSGPAQASRPTAGAAAGHGPQRPLPQDTIDVEEAMRPKPKGQRDPKKVAGKRFGKFTVLKEIGRGGMGIVYLAVDPSLRRQVALKILIGGEGVTDVSIKRFMREARAMSHLRHPHIVPVHEAGQIGKRHYFTMDVIQGKEFGEIAPLMSVRERLKICYKVCKALEFAHSEGIIHRDLKPGNIMVDVHHNPFVMDFGLAKDLSSQSMQSVTGTVLGTPSYMSPEQAQGMVHDIDHRSDIYSVGSILYELITGRVAFQGSTMFDTLFAVVNKPHPPLRSVAPETDEALATIVDRCLEKDPGERYQQMGALAQDLYDYLRGGRVAARGIAAHRRGWRWLQEHTAIKLGALAVVPALVVALVMLVVFSGTPVLDEVERAVASGDGQRMVNAMRILREKAVYEEAYPDGELRRRVLDSLYATVGGPSVEAEELALSILEAIGDVDDPARILEICRERDLPEKRRRRILKAIRVLAMQGHLPPPDCVEDLVDMSRDRRRSLALRLDLVATLTKVIPKRKALFAELRPLAEHPAEPVDLRLAALKEIGARMRLHDGREMALMMRCSADEDRNIRHAAEQALDEVGNKADVFAAYGIGHKTNPAYAGAANVLKLNLERTREAERIVEEMENPGRTEPDPEDQAPAVAIARKLHATDEAVRMRACYDLGKYGDATSVKQLINRIRLDDSRDVKLVAAKAVVKLAAADHPVPHAKVVELLSLPDAGSRAAAAVLLGELEHRPSAPALAARLAEEETTHVQEQLIAALGRIGDPGQLPAMREWFDKHQDDTGLPMLAAWRSHKAFAGRAYPHLIDAMESVSPTLREAAAGVLEDLTGEEFDDPAGWRRWLEKRQQADG